MPACWDQAGDGTIAAGPSAFGSSLWGQSGSLARINLYTTNRTDWLLSPTFDLSAGGWELVVEASANDYGNSGAFSGMGSDDSVQLVLSTDGGMTWTSIYSFSTANSPTLTPTNYTVDLSVYTGTNNIFGIRAADGPVNDIEDYYFNVHSFEIRVPPTCADPSALGITNLQSTSADLTWTAGNGVQFGWEVSVVDAGNMPVGGTPSATTTYNATGLTSNNDYDFYVREVCTVGNTSAWIGPFAFTTPCGVYTPDYAQDYTTYVPECWEEATGLLTSSSVLTAGSSAWTSDGFGNNGSSGAARLNIWTTGQDEWMISPSIDLTGGPFQLEYDIALTTFSGSNATTMDPDDSLAVVISTDNGATWSNTNILQTYTDGSEPSVSGQREYIDLSAYTGVVKFGFYGKSDQNLVVDNNVYIDNFLVTSLCLPTTGTDVQTACDSYTWIDGNTYTSSNNTASFVLQNANVNGCDSIVELDLTINNTPTNTVTTNGAAITADANGFSYQWLDCDNGNAVVAGENSQTFVAAVSGNYAVEVSNNGCIDTSACELITVLPADLIITEINYNGAEAGTDSTEYVEVYNNGAQTVNMSGYTFSQGITFTAGPNTLVPAGGYIVFAIDSMVMVNVYGYTGAYEFTGGLSNAGEDITIVDANGVTIDSVNYDDAAPWPTGFGAGQPDGGGASLILCDYTTDNNNGANWSVATTATGSNINGFDVFGSPGAANVCVFECPSAFSIAACDSYTVPSGNATYTTSGVYMDTILGSTGCDSIMTITLTINIPTTSTDIQTACDSLVWNGMTYNTSGTNTWVGMNAAGCDSTVTLDLTINNSVTSTDVQTACDSLVWNGMTYTTSGTYTWIGSTTTGCDSTVTLDLTINTVDVSVTNNDPSITANASGATYVWLDCDNGNAPIAGETGQMFTATANGNYAVEITNNGCVDTSACTPIVTVSLEDLDALGDVTVYPNPVDNIVNVELGSLESASVRLLDVNGKVLFLNENVNNSVYTFEMNQEPGVYFVEVSTNNNVKRFKVVKN